MTVWNKPQDIMDNIMVGMKCDVYNSGSLLESTKKEGVVTSIRECHGCHFHTKDWGTPNEWVCNKKIGINNKEPGCYTYRSSILAIKNLRSYDFITEDEFKV